MNAPDKYARLPTLEEWLDRLENIDFRIGAADRWAIAALVRQRIARASKLEGAVRALIADAETLAPNGDSCVSGKELRHLEALLAEPTA